MRLEYFDTQTRVLEGFAELAQFVVAHSPVAQYAQDQIYWVFVI